MRLGVPLLPTMKPSENAAAYPLVAAHEIGRDQHVGEALGLLEREHAQREPSPGRDALGLAPQPIVEGRGQHIEATSIAPRCAT